ncbi:MAG: TonB-dependent receptor [Candidatus Kapabacteria bacterium]|jgi:outer membrane cobalamin receptor|nr:TonB-dependent receptor [Candidatus Kapabacteria bacterium]
MKNTLTCHICCWVLLQATFQAVFSQTRTNTASRSIASAQSSSTQATVRFGAVDISASRLLSASERLAAPATVVNAATMRTVGARQIADALPFVPGVFVRNYGGLGGLKTLSLRGASASQTAVLLDGVRMQSTQSGQFDFSTLPASMVEEIEVVRGGGAAFLGGNAMGGAVNIRTKSHVQRSEFHAEAEAASFQEFRGNIAAALPFDLFGTGKGGFHAGAEYQTARGNYPFPFNDFGQNITLERMNADFRNLSAQALVTAQSHRFTLQTRALVRSSERGTPGAVVQGNVEMAQARLGEDDVLLSLKAAYIPAEQVLFSFLASGKFNTLHYRDPDARQFGASGINERFVAQDFSFGGRLHFDETTNSPLVAVNHEWLLEHTISTLRGNMLQRDVGTFVERINTGLAGKGAVRWKFSHDASSPTLASNAALRFDYFSDVGAAVSPLLGSALLLDSSWTIRAEWSWNFRPPAFNELYYLNFGNSRLQPERAQCWNLGLTWNGSRAVFGEVFFGRLALSASIDGFFHRTQNQILAVQTTPFTISAQNIAEAQSFGVESRFSAALEEKISLTVNYTFQRSTNETPTSFALGKQLIYTPQHLASAIFSINNDLSPLLGLPQSLLQSGFTAQYAGERFYLPSNSPESVLPAFVVIGVFSELTLNLAETQASMRLQADNLFDERYAVIRNFPMPGRSLRLMLKAVLR